MFKRSNRGPASCGPRAARSARTATRVAVDRTLPATWVATPWNSSTPITPATMCSVRAGSIAARRARGAPLAAPGGGAATVHNATCAVLRGGRQSCVAISAWDVACDRMWPCNLRRATGLPHGGASRCGVTGDARGCVAPVRPTDWRVLAQSRACMGGGPDRRGRRCAAPAARCGDRRLACAPALGARAQGVQPDPQQRSARTTRTHHIPAGL